MARTFEGGLSGAAFRIAVVQSRFNAVVCDRLASGALEALAKHGVVDDNVTVIRVPGAFELPQAARRAAATGQYDAVVCVGAVVRGETPHFDYICQATAAGIGEAAGVTGVPITFGVLTTEDLDQAMARAGGDAGNKGAEAAAAAIELADLYRQLDGS